jgi:hypothetical protein
MTETKTVDVTKVRAEKAGRSIGYARGAAAAKSVLVEGEEILVMAQIHPAIYWKSVAVLIFAVILMIFVAPMLGAFFFFVGTCMAATAAMTQHFLLLALTNKRILARYGILQVEIVGMNYRNIESVESERMLPGHIFGYANIVIQGTGQRYIRIPFVANAVEFRKVYDQISLAREEKAIGA